MLSAPPAKRRVAAVPAAARVAPDTWLVAAIVAVAAVLRFATISSQSFWLDEATSVHEVGLSLGAMLHEIRINETTPPLYFVLAWVWTRVFGHGELGIRSLSALAGTATVVVAYLCGRELVSRRAGVVAAALCAVSPFMIWYSQEARSYALFGLFTALTLLFCARSLRTAARRDLVAWTLSAALALLTHFFAIFLVAPTALLLLHRLRDRRALLAVAVAAAVQLAVLPLAIGDTHHPLGWILLFPRSTRIEQIPVTLGLSELYRSTGVSWGLPGAAILLVAVAGLLWRGGAVRERRGAALAGGVAAFGLLAPVVLALLGRDYVFGRNFMGAFVPLAVVLGAACTAPRTRVAGGLLAAVLVGGFLWGNAKVDGSALYRRPDWRGVATALGVPSGPRAIVAYDGNVAEQPLSVYLPRTQFSYGGIPADARPVTVGEVDVVGDVAQAPPPHLPAGVRLIASATVGQYLVERFTVTPPWRLVPRAFALQAPALLGPGDGTRAAVLIQR
jgi:4-amino-4-deoxy-L-arabinose transferase-like glycosyltransferase